MNHQRALKQGGIVDRKERLDEPVGLFQVSRSLSIDCMNCFVIDDSVRRDNAKAAAGDPGSNPTDQTGRATFATVGVRPSTEPSL
jgi:hypothetical protein